MKLILQTFPQFKINNLSTDIATQQSVIFLKRYKIMPYFNHYLRKQILKNIMKKKIENIKELIRRFIFVTFNL